MKITKKLLPLATIASISTIVAPSIASCSKAICMTSELTFKPSQYSGTNKNVSSLYWLTENYFKDVKVPGQDILYTCCQYLTETKKELEADDHYRDINIDFTARVNSFAIDEKVSSFEKLDISASYSLDYTVSYKYVRKAAEEGNFQSYEVKNRNNVTITFNHLKTTITFEPKTDTNPNHWYFTSSADKNYEWNFNYSFYIRNKMTTKYNDGSEKLIEEANRGEDLYSKKNDDTEIPTKYSKWLTFESYFLQPCTKN